MDSFFSFLPLAEISGGELTIIGLTSVFLSLVGLSLVVQGFNWWYDRGQARQAAAAAAAAGNPAGTSESAPGANGDAANEESGEDERVRVAIGLALALATRESSAAVPYEVDGQSSGGPISAWRASARPQFDRIEVVRAPQASVASAGPKRLAGLGRGLSRPSR